MQAVISGPALMPGMVTSLQHLGRLLRRLDRVDFFAAIGPMFSPMSIGVVVMRPSEFIAQRAKQSQHETIDRSGDAILGLLRKAADLAKEDCDQALSMAHELSLKLRASEDRAEKLQAKI